jgi:hypothetical protein
MRHGAFAMTKTSRESAAIRNLPLFGSCRKLRSRSVLRGRKKLILDTPPHRETLRKARCVPPTPDGCLQNYQRNSRRKINWNTFRISDVVDHTSEH